MNVSSCIVCQLGAREHYALAAALHAQGWLHKLYTDAWLPQGNPFSRVAGALLPRLRERYAKSLGDAPVTGFTASLVQFELHSRLIGRTAGWDYMIARNEWFQERVLDCLKQELVPWPGQEKPVIFSYSYSGRRVLEYAKKQGWTTVLGQIDPGQFDEEIVVSEARLHPELKPQWQHVPPRYWNDWLAECRFADRIIVNSEWSRQALLQVGIASDKLFVIPLMYDPDCARQSQARQYPAKFDENRPLRVLFLGSLTIRKGIAAVLGAARKLVAYPVEFWFVGSPGVELPADLRRDKRIQWVGPVRRGETSHFFRHCDLFLFPTLSDGFGLTQLEAMSHGLPVIASSRCGEVVLHGENGLVLHEIGEEQLAAAILDCLANPGRLAHWSANALIRAEAFSPAAILPRFLKVLS